MLFRQKNMESEMLLNFCLPKSSSEFVCVELTKINSIGFMCAETLLLSKNYAVDVEISAESK